MAQVWMNDECNHMWIFMQSIYIYIYTAGTVRHCELCGSAYSQQFTVTFTIREDQLCIENLKIEVDVETQFELCTLLTR